MVLVLIITVIVGVMVYYNVSTVDELDPITERFTGLVNTTDYNMTLYAKPNSGGATDFSGTWYNSSSAAWATLAAGLYVLDETNLRLNTNTTNDGLNMTAVNVTYYSIAGALNRDSIGVTVASVWAIAPLIAIVIIAGIILAVVTGFGKRGI